MAGTTSGAVGAADRVPTPDLLRGLALLGIALANCVSYLHGRELGPLLRPVVAAGPDRGVDALVGTFVDNRAFPVFTLLFAYGFVMLTRRQDAAHGDPRRTRTVLLRRSAALVAIGSAHLVLLFDGDIVMTYGLLGLGLVWLVRRRDAVVVLVGAAGLLPFAVLGGLDGLGAAAGPVAASWGQAQVERLAAWGLTLLAAPLLVTALLAPAALGVLLARRRVLEEPGAHLPLLRRMTVVGLPVGVLGALPLVLLATRVTTAGPLPQTAAGVLHGVTGLAGALGFVGLVAWASARRAWPRPVRAALVAVGSRSLTCYLLQSVLLVPLLAPWALDLSEGAGTARVSLLAVGVYLVTVVVAVLLQRAGRAGPAERLLRRLTYGTQRARGAPGRPQRNVTGRSRSPG